VPRPSGDLGRVALKSLRHYLFHLLYPATQLPMIVFWLRTAHSAAAAHR
jgi:hypothetical protein